MAAAHLNGDAEVAGNFTSGGTESIILAVKAARDYARDRRPEITQPELLLPTTAHAAFQKAAHYLDLTPVMVPVDPTTFKADPDAMRRAISPRTVLMVGSAISYAHGVIDPIRELGQIALEHNLLLHVDACMGGFLLPYFRRLGAPVPDFDFSVPGVTSISMDFHKYAFAAKGASTILYRSKELRKYQMYACASWTGYTVINPTVQSSKSPGPLAAAWAVLHFLGDDGYLEIARQVLDATRRIAAGIEAIPELRLLGQPEMNLVAFTSDTVSVFHVIDEMKAARLVHPTAAQLRQLAREHPPVDQPGERQMGRRDARRPARLRGRSPRRCRPASLAAQIKETFASIDPDTLTDEMFQSMLGMAGIQGTELPARMAEINEVLNALPAAMREKLLTAFLNDLYRYREH